MPEMGKEYAAYVETADGNIPIRDLQAKQDAYDLDKRKASAIVETVSGEDIQVQDSGDSALAGLKLFGKSRQNTTTGAQLLKPPKEESFSSNGVSWTYNSDGSVSASGTVDGNSDYYVIGGKELYEDISLEAGTYHVKAEGLVSGAMFYVVKETGASVLVNLKSDTVESDVDIEEGEKYRVFYRAQNALNQSFSGEANIKVMLNSGSSALPWEPYTGGKASPNPDYPQDIEVPGSKGNVNLTITGEQLLPIINRKYSADGMTGIVQENGSLIVNGTPSHTYVNLISGYITLKPGDYYISGGDDLPGSVYAQISYKGNNLVNKAFHLDENERVRYSIQNGGSTDNISNYKIEPILNKGKSASLIEPYKNTSAIISTPSGLPGIQVESGGNYTDADGKQWICDEVDFERGKYVQRINKIVYDGGSDEEWFKAGVNVERYFTNVTPHAVYGHGLCNYFTYSQGGETINKFTFNSDGDSCGFAFASAGTGTSIEGWKSFLQQKNEEGNPLTVYYELITPVETELSTEELAAYAALTAYYPTTNITTDSDPEAGIEMDYVADTKTWIENRLTEIVQTQAATNAQILNQEV